MRALISGQNDAPSGGGYEADLDGYLITGREIEFGDEIEGRTPSMDKNLAFT